jgi:hypothetical protein
MRCAMMMLVVVGSMGAVGARALAADGSLIDASPSLMLAQNSEAGSGAPAGAPEGAPAADSQPSRGKAFGEAGSWYWGVGGGVAFTDEATEYNGNLTFGTFLTEGFEFNFGVGGWHHDQDDEDGNEADDAQSINPVIGFRYHFMAKEPIDFYIEAGIGLLFSTDDVPADGTSFNFTPRAGVGALWRLDEASGVRLDTGVRWHHISNATVSGSDDNPSRDSIMVYVGVIFPIGN